MRRLSESVDQWGLPKIQGSVAVVELNPFTLKYRDEDERLGALTDLVLSGKTPIEWAKSVDLSEPIEVTVWASGEMTVNDGHHRQLAAQILMKPVMARLSIRNAKSGTIEQSIKAHQIPIDRSLLSGVEREIKRAREKPDPLAAFTHALKTWNSTTSDPERPLEEAAGAKKSQPKIKQKEVAIKGGRKLLLKIEDESRWWPNRFWINAHLDGQKVGRIEVDDAGYGDYMMVTNADVDYDFRRLGIATAMYDFAEKISGKELVPYESSSRAEEPMSDDSKAFWHARRGYTFRSDEDEEDSLEEAASGSLTAEFEKISADAKFFTEWFKQLKLAKYDWLDSLLALVGRYDEEADGLTDKEIKQIAKEAFRTQLSDFMSSFTSSAKIERGGITLWRCITVEDPQAYLELLKAGNYPDKETGIGNYRGLGVYWSYDQSAANCHWGKSGGKKILLKAVAPISAIDVRSTLSMNMDVDTGMVEAEIRLKKGAAVKLVGAFEGGQDILNSKKALPLVASSDGESASSSVYHTSDRIPEYLGREMSDRVSKIQIAPVEHIYPNETPSPTKVKKIKELMQAGEPLPAILVNFAFNEKNPDWDALSVVDGHHRLEAAKQLGMTHVPVRIVVPADDWADVKAGGGFKLNFGEALT